MPIGRYSALVSLLIGCAVLGVAHAATTLRVVTGHGVWDSYATEAAVNAGLFGDGDPVVEFLYSAGTGETMQAVISQSADIGEVGTLGAFSAFLKGAPVRIIGPEATGSAEYWYVRSDSPIHSIKDTDGKTIGFSSVGSSTHSIVRAFISENGVSAQGVATGGPAATLTAVMSRQIDVGWASPPFGLKEIDEGKIRIIARGNDVSSVRGQTIRVIVTNMEALKGKRDALQRYMDRRARAVELMYNDPQPIRHFAESNHISEEMAKRVREFYPKSMLQLDEIAGLDNLLQEAVVLKYLPRPLTSNEIAEAIQPMRPRR